MRGLRRSWILPVLVSLWGGRALALDFVHAKALIEEIRFVRNGPYPQTFHFRSSRVPGGDWPARLAVCEKARRRKLGRFARIWRGFTGGVVAWSVDGEILQGPRRARTIGHRLETWAETPLNLRFHGIAENPGGRGRRLFQRRVKRLFVDLKRVEERTIRDPFQEFRHDGDSKKWDEWYRFRFASGTWIEVSGPLPEVLPAFPTEPTSDFLFEEFPLEKTEAGSPETWFRTTSPNYVIRFGPRRLSAFEEQWLGVFLGIDAGVTAFEN